MPMFMFGNRGKDGDMTNVPTFGWQSQPEALVNNQLGGFLNFGQNLGGAMGQMWGLNQQNAAMSQANKQNALHAQALNNQFQLGNNWINSMTKLGDSRNQLLAAMFGGGNKQAAPAAAPYGSPGWLNSKIGEVRQQQAMPPSPMQSQGRPGMGMGGPMQGGPAAGAPAQARGMMNLNSTIPTGPLYSPQMAGMIGAADQQQNQAANNIYGQMSPALSQAAFSDARSPSAVNFTQGGQNYGTATPGGPAGTGGPQGGFTGTMGIQAQNFFGPANMQAMQDRLNKFSASALPQMQGSNTNMSNAFQNYLQGMSGRIMAGYGRAGSEAQAKHNLSAADAQAEARNRAQRAMIEWMQGNQEYDLGQQQIMNRMLGSIYGI